MVQRAGMLFQSLPALFVFGAGVGVEQPGGFSAAGVYLAMPQVLSFS